MFNFIMKATALVIFFIAMIMGLVAMGWAQEYTNTQIVDAIYQAEGGAKAQYAYGIRSVKYSTIEEARRICYNTVRNNRQRYAKYGYRKYPDYLSFLASRYCPVNCDNDRGTNKYWLRNVKYYLAKQCSQ